MGSPEVRMTLHWSVPPASVRAINNALNDLMVKTRAEPGCVGCTLSTLMGAHAGFDYIEEWEREADLVSQLRSDRFAKLAQLLESATEPPTVEFSLPSGIRGIEYAREARLSQGGIAG